MRTERLGPEEAQAVGAGRQGAIVFRLRELSLDATHWSALGSTPLESWQSLVNPGVEIPVLLRSSAAINGSLIRITIVDDQPGGESSGVLSLEISPRDLDDQWLASVRRWGSVRLAAVPDTYRFSYEYDEGRFEEYVLQNVLTIEGGEMLAASTPLD